VGDASSGIIQKAISTKLQIHFPIIHSFIFKYLFLIMQSAFGWNAYIYIYISAHSKHPFKILLSLFQIPKTRFFHNNYDRIGGRGSLSVERYRKCVCVHCMWNLYEKAVLTHTLFAPSCNFIPYLHQNVVLFTSLFTNVEWTLCFTSFTVDFDLTSPGMATMHVAPKFFSFFTFASNRMTN